MQWEPRLRWLMERPPDIGYGFFVFMAAKQNPGASEVERCDNGSWGPVLPVNPTDPRNGTTFNTHASFISSTKQLKEYTIVYDLAPDGYIIYLELCISKDDDFDRIRDLERENFGLNNIDTPAAARTFPELLRLMWEWEQTIGPPFNGVDVAAVTAQRILNRFRAMGLTDALLSEVVDVVPPMQVSKYLSNAPNARQRPPVEQIPGPPSSLLNWLELTADPAGGGE